MKKGAKSKNALNENALSEALISIVKVFCSDQCFLDFFSQFFLFFLCVVIFIGSAS